MIISKVKKTVKKYSLLERGDKIVVALSGGPDSVALMDVLAKMAPEMDLQIIAAHFNHELRGRESDEDEIFCRQLTEKYDLPFHARRMDRSLRKRGESPEDFYRRQRYLFLQEAAEKFKAQKVALGHNMEDQAQTILMRLLQGSSLEGLKGIPLLREGRFIRPLIEISRPEIMEYLKKNNLVYRQDSTNKNTQFLRNKIRIKLIPFLKKEFNPRLENSLAQTAEILRRENDFIKNFVAQALQSDYIRVNDGSYRVDIGWLRGLHPAIRFRLLKSFLETLKPEEKRFSFAHVEALDKIIGNQKTGKKLNLPGMLSAFIEYNHLFLENKRDNLFKRNYEYPLAADGVFFIREKNINLFLQKVKREDVDYSSQNKIYLDLDRLSPPLCIRNRRNGDWFEPLGMKGSKKIKDYFIDRKIPRRLRDSVMLLADSLSVVWIEGMHLSERAKITDNTINVLEITFTKP